MTLNDLKDEIAALGFDDSVRLDKTLQIAANRALVTLFTERPIAKTVRIILPCQAPLSYTEKIVHRGGEEVELTLRGRAYAFRVSGKGHFTVSEGLSTVRQDVVPTQIIRPPFF